MIYVTADEHYGDEHIIKFCYRPFDSVLRQTQQLTWRFNRAVNHEDMIYHLGDFSFYNSITTQILLSGLTGKHIIIRGNHDRGPASLVNCGFVAALDEAVISWEGKKFLLSHRPVYEIRSGIDGVIHGHIHNISPEEIEARGEDPHIPPWNVNVSVEVTGYRPITMGEVLKRLEEQLGQK